MTPGSAAGGVCLRWPPRVLHVISSLDAGGAERVALTVCSGLTDCVHTVALAGAGTLLPLMPARVRVRPARNQLALADLMVRTRPDVVHTWHDESLLMAVVPAAQLGIPVVHRLYNVPSIQNRYDGHGADHIENVGLALRAVAKVVSLSGAAADDAVTFYGIERPQVIHNGFPLAGRRGVSAAAMSKPDGRFVILNVARLAVEKGHTYLIEAVGRIARRQPHVELWIAGIGPLEADLRRQAAAAGIGDRVKFLGFCEDVSALHSAADMFVFPSVTEGFGNALGEALIAGLPVVAFDLPAIRRDVLGDGFAPTLVPIGDAAALAATLDRLVSDDAARTALAGLARRRGEQFRVTRMLEEYRALYVGLAEEWRVAA